MTNRVQRAYRSIPDRCPGRCGQRPVVVHEVPFFRELEAQGPHAVAVIHAHQVIRFGKRSRFSVLLPGVDGFPPAHKRTPPAIRCGVEEQSEIALIRRLVLLPGKCRQVGIQRAETRMGQPCGIVLIGKDLFAPDRFAVKHTHIDRLRILGPVHIYVYIALRYHIHRFLETLSPTTSLAS